MPIARADLDVLARRYVASMTSIRGRRVHRLLLRELAAYDHVLPVTLGDGAPGLLALADAGGAALCRSDGRGPSAEVVRWARLDGASVTAAHDLLKDSLPITAWTIWHPSLERAGGAVTVAAADLPAADRERLGDALRRLGA